MTTGTARINMAAPIECNSCGTLFAMTAFLDSERRKDAGTFYCPNGHSLWFGESEADKLRRHLKNAKADATWERERREQAERSLSATRGVVTRLRKRAHAGVCPFGCRRHFTNLERHVASKHPGEKLEAES